ncbi:uncharacterized protein [Nicotiana sylvestris]|uniref:uncharacterized protein n=1 Tax=Nicotiana sylvestris TaxID=4096 RepID=UPI00388CD7AF
MECFECGATSHIRKYCPRLMSSRPQEGSHAIMLAPVASPPTQPARGRGQAARGGGQPSRCRLRGRGQSDGVQHYFYSFPTRVEAYSSDVVITSIVIDFHRDASVLFDPGFTYSYVSSYFASYLVMTRDSLSAYVYVSTSMGVLFVVDSVYRSCVVSIESHKTSVDLLLLDMVDFNVILGMDWLSPYQAILDFHSKTVTLAMPGLLRLE